MPLIASNKSESHIEPIPPDNYQAVCFSVIDIGTHESEFKGVKKKLHKIIIIWEIPELRLTITKDGNESDIPRVISKTYTLSLSEKSNLFADLTSWRGVPFTEDELEAFDVFSVVGANCLLQVINKTNKDGRVYSNVANISKLMKGMAKLQPENNTLTYSMIEDGYTCPENIPDWITKQIKESFEYQAVEKAKKNPMFQRPEEQENDFAGEQETPPVEAEDLPF